MLLLKKNRGRNSARQSLLGHLGYWLYTAPLCQLNRFITRQSFTPIHFYCSECFIVTEWIRPRKEGRLNYYQASMISLAHIPCLPSYLQKKLIFHKMFAARIKYCCTPSQNRTIVVGRKLTSSHSSPD